MKRREFNLGLSAAAVSTALGVQAAQAADDSPAWAINADVAECCSCQIPCPCNFGRPTDKRCEGNRLIQITEGHVGDADLAGIDFLATFEMRKWARLYVSDAISDAQYQALEQVLPLAFGGFHKLMLSIERVPMSIERKSRGLRFETPASTVEMKLVEGLGGEPIRINGLPSPMFHDYTQYESVVHTHKHGDKAWSHQGTNGFTSKMIARSA